MSFLVFFIEAIKEKNPSQARSYFSCCGRYAQEIHVEHHESLSHCAAQAPKMKPFFQVTDLLKILIICCTIPCFSTGFIASKAARKEIVDASVVLIFFYSECLPSYPAFAHACNHLKPSSCIMQKQMMWSVYPDWEPDYGDTQKA